VSLFTSRLGKVLGPFHCLLSILAFRLDGLSKVGLAGPWTVAVNWSGRAARAGGNLTSRLLTLLLHPQVMLHERLIHQELNTK
jgi:hypothetical protein